MGTRHLIDLPMQFLRPSSSGDNVKEIAFKTIPSVSKAEIKNVLESMFGLEIDKVRTLNMKGKKKWRGGRLIARPDYKKAYITLKKPLSAPYELHSAASTVTSPPEKAGRLLIEDGVRSLRLDEGVLWQADREKELVPVGNELFSGGTLRQQQRQSSGN